MNKKLTITILALLLVPSLALGVSSQNKFRAESTGEEIKTKIQEMREAKETVKEKIKEEILEKVKTRALLSIERATKKYEMTKARISGMPNIDDAYKEKIAGEIDVVINDLLSQKEKVNNAETTDEVRAVMAEVKLRMKNGYNAVKAAVSAIHASHLNKIIDKLSGILNDLTAKSTGIDGAEALQKTAKDNLDAARAAVLAEDFKEAKNKILDARKNLIQLSQKIKTETESTEEE